MAKNTESEMSNLHPLRVLMVEDSEDDALLVLRELKKGGYNPEYERVETAAAMRKALQDKTWDVILCDYQLPSFNGIEAIAVLKETNIDIPVIIVSGAIGEETAVECMRLGAYDYIMKGNLSRLVPAIERELKEAESRAQRKQAEEELRESEEKYRTILENMQEGYFEMDLAGNYTFVNDAECRNIGYPKEELIGMNNRQYQDETTAQKTYQLFRRLYRTGEPVKALDVEIIRKNGTKGFNEVSVSLIRDSEGKPIGFRGISWDITERKRTEKALEESEKRYREISIVDDLTQLYNSRHFYVQLKIELDRSNRYEQPLTLLLLDLDDFKQFNDAYGHVEGDQVLWRFGQVAKRCLRQTDFAYRYGGEEFTILLPMTTSADGAVTAERIRTEFKKETFSPAPDQDGHVTVSIGLAQYKPQEDMKAFVHRVDQLMYQGKKNGKDRVCSE